MFKIDWKRALVVELFGFVWLQVVVVALKAWPTGSLVDRNLLYLPATLSPAAVLFVTSIGVGLWYATMTHNNLFLVVVVLGMLGFWSTVGLHTSGLFPSLDQDPIKVFAALYTVAYMTRFSTLSMRFLIGD